MLAVKRDTVVLPEQPWQVPHAYIFGLKIIMQVVFFIKAFTNQSSPRVRTALPDTVPFSSSIISELCIVIIKNVLIATILF